MRFFSVFSFAISSFGVLREDTGQRFHERTARYLIDRNYPNLAILQLFLSFFVNRAMLETSQRVWKTQVMMPQPRNVWNKFAERIGTFNWQRLIEGQRFLLTDLIVVPPAAPHTNHCSNVSAAEPAASSAATPHHHLQRQASTNNRERA